MKHDEQMHGKLFEVEILPEPEEDEKMKMKTEMFLPMPKYA